MLKVAIHVISNLDMIFSRVWYERTDENVGHTGTEHSQIQQERD